MSSTLKAWIERHEYRERHNEPAGADHGVHLAIQGDDREPVRMIVRYSVSVGSFSGITSIYEVEHAEGGIMTPSLSAVLILVEGAARAESASRSQSLQLSEWFDAELDSMVRDPWNYEGEGVARVFQ